MWPKGDSSKVNIIAVVVPIAIIIVSIIIFAIVAIVLLIKSRCRKQQAFIGKKMAYAYYYNKIYNFHFLP